MYVSSCEHSYMFQCTVFSFDDQPRAGTSARARYLEDKYYCSKCLHTVYRNKREHGTSYHDPVAGVLPK